MKIETSLFGESARLFTITNKNHMRLTLTDIGASIMNIIVFDKNSSEVDIALGYDSPEGYLSGNDAHGATVGRIANRIGGGKITINDVVYHLDKNDGSNTLHGGNSKYFHRMWEAKVIDGDIPQVIFLLFSPDGDQGLPGNADISVTYSLTDENEIIIDYHATSDTPTVFNLTNHVYFNLNGHNAGSINDHLLRLDCTSFTKIDAELIPTGENIAVAETPMDFTAPKTLGADVNADYDQLILAGGYDHNYVINNPSFDRPFAMAAGDKTGISMEVYTDLPGVQLYCGNFLKGKSKGKDNAKYGYREGFCLETQFFPNSPNTPAFPRNVFNAFEPFVSRTIYKIY